MADVGVGQTKSTVVGTLVLGTSNVPRRVP